MQKILLLVAAAFFVVVSLPPARVGGAEPNRPVRIGALTDSWGPTPGVVGLRDGLVELGYRENVDFVMGVRFTQGDISALSAAAQELVALDIDLLFTTNPASAKAAKMATDRIPIVFTEAGDPLELGLIQSFARPGRNITGVTNLDLKLDAKRLEIFKQIIPGLRRVLLVYDPSEDFSNAQAKVYRETASRMDIILVEKPARTQKEALATFSGLRKKELDGILAPRSLSSNIPGFVLEATSRHGMPTMFNSSWYVERGGLASYSANHYESGRMAARLAEKIIKGASPSEIPVEVNNNIDFVINLTVAKALGIEVAPQVLYQANRVIR